MKKLCTAKAMTASTTTTACERVCAALGCGVLEMLSGRDVLRILSTSRLLHVDASVVGCALRCVATHPRWLRLDTRRLTHEPSTVQLAWRVQVFLDHELEALSDLHPFVLLLSPADATSASLAEALTDVTAVLPIPHEELSSVKPSPSSLPSLPACGVHWNHIGRVGTNPDSDVFACVLCDASVTSVCQYRDDTEAFTTEFEHQLEQHETQWEAQGGSPRAVLDQSFAFQQAYFAQAPFFSAYVANQDDDAVLQYICRSGRFPLACGDTATDALSVTARETCRRVYRPVKRLLTTLCASPPVCTSVVAPLSCDVVAGVCGRVAVGFVVAS